MSPNLANLLVLLATHAYKALNGVDSFSRQLCSRHAAIEKPHYPDSKLETHMDSTVWHLRSNLLITLSSSPAPLPYGSGS